MIVEETEPAPALTPDVNAALVDDFGGNKHLITVTTKAGNYFYILIDRANEDKKTAVHFLNQVDEADLMALMEDENVKEKPAAVCCFCMTSASLLLKLLTTAVNRIFRDISLKVKKLQTEFCTD